MKTKTGTTKDTWDCVAVGDFLDLRGRERLMKRIFSNLLEHDLGTSSEMAKATRDFEPEMRRRVENFVTAYLELREHLLEATKCSDKY